MAGLQIRNIKIKDFRQYFGDTEIELACTEDAMNNIIEGENGAGKSNLLNAVTFCFYGEEDHKENNVDDEDAELPLLNNNVLAELDENESATGYVEIEIGEEQADYVFRREFETYKITANETNDVVKELTILKRQGTEWNETDSPMRTRNEILPPNVRQYFIFDAESLRDFFGPGYQQRLEDGILDVSHIELVERGIVHLERTRRKIEQDSSDASGEPAKLESRMSNKESKLESVRRKIKNNKQQLENTRKNLRDVEDQMQDASSERVQKLYDSRDNLEQRLRKLRTKKKEARSELHELTVEAGPRVYAHGAIERSYNIFSELDLPPDIRAKFLEELIENEECICGDDISAQPRKLERLKELRVNVQAVDESTMQGEFELEGMLESVPELVSDLQKQRAEISDTDENIEEVNRELKETSEDLKTFDIPDEVDVAALEEQREDLKQQQSQLLKEQGKLEAKEEKIENEIDELHTQYKEELKKVEEYQQTAANLEFLENATQEFKDIKSRILSQIRDQVVEDMNTYYNELIWKNEEFDIDIDKDYNIKVINEKGQNQLGSLSAGETQVLALSFLSALSQVSGFRAPILIDTPLARISGKPKEHIASNLPGYLGDTQVTFLMTDEEYTDDVEGLMKNQVSNEYKLEFSDGKTEVIRQ